MIDTSDNFNIAVGQRLKKIRNIINNGRSATLVELSYLLGISRDKLTNYEIGRSSLPISVLSELYIYGINPVYIINGEEDIYAKSRAGTKLRKRVTRIQEKKAEIKKNIMNITAENQTINLSAAASEIPPQE